MSLAFVGDICRTYGYRPEEDMERTMSKYRFDDIAKRQIEQYFVCLYRIGRIKAYLEKSVLYYDSQTETKADMFFRKYDLPIRYSADIKIPFSTKVGKYMEDC